MTRIRFVFVYRAWSCVFVCTREHTKICSHGIEHACIDVDIRKEKIYVAVVKMYVAIASMYLPVAYKIPPHTHRP